MSGDHERLQAWANSALLRVVQYGVTGIAVPGVIWFANATIARLDKIDASIQVQIRQADAFEYRIKSLETGAVERRAAIDTLQRQAQDHDYSIRRLEERANLPPAPPRRP